MQQMRCVSMFVVVLAMLSAPATAQIQILPGAPGEPIQLPPRGQANKTGTGRIKGRLVAAETGSPIRRAQVRISSTEMMPKTAVTDNEGRYEFRDLPAGKFTITASKSGFVTIGYGQSRPFEAAKPIELGDGQALDKADITMPRGSVISGRIVDEFGEALPDAVVTAMRSTWMNGRRRLQPAGRAATTNDLGQYRIYGLPPGEYYVSATLRGGQEMMVMEMAAAASIRLAGDVAGGGDMPRSGYAPTYYPGTPNGSDAQRVALAAGQETQNTDFGLVPVRLAKVSGTVIGSDGRPMSGVMVTVAPRNQSEAGFLFGAGGGRSDANGNFTINGVTPGDYTLQARGIQVFSSTDGDRQVFTMTRTTVMGGGGDGSSEFGSVPLAVTGEDVSNVVIVTTKGATVNGRVVWEGGSRPTANTLRVTAAAADGDGAMGLPGASSSITPEGTFEIKGLAGPRIFRVSNLPPGWVLKAVRLNGGDITDTGADIRPGGEPITGLEIVLSSKLTEVNGSVKAGSDPATDYTIVIFSEDSQKWTVPMTRHVMSARPNQEGRFQLKNLPAGSYYAIALDYIAQGDWNDPEVLEKLKTRASRFSLDEGETQTLELTLQGG